MKLLSNALSSSSFIPNYSFQEWVEDTFWGAVYPFWARSFWTEYWPDLLASSVYFISGFYVCRYILRLDDPKRYGWALSALNSLVVAPISIPICFILFQQWFLEGGAAVSDFMMSSHRLTSFMCVFFWEFMILDLVFGVVHYRSEIDYLTWIHHVSYAILTMNALYWQYANGFISFFPEEVPTVILSIGHVFPRCRTDVGFGVTFLMFRIIFHILMLVVAIVFIRLRSMSWISALITTLLHVWWFARWIRSMRKKEEERKAAGLHAEEEGNCKESDRLLGPEEHHPLPDAFKDREKE